MNGRNKTLLALLPVVAAVVLTILVRKDLSNQLWTWVILGLLVLGGILAATFVTKSMARARPERGVVFLGFMFLVILIGYVVTFFFSGCLLVLGISG